MHEIETVLGLLVAVAVLAWLASRIKVPYPIVLVVGGLAISFIPHLPRVQLRPDIVFILFLPPLLYNAALLTSWRDFRANLRPISMLAIGLVLFTTCLVAALARYLIPGMSWGPAFVLGAIVSPPDAIAAVAIMRRLRVPKRIQIILEGESLVNDATALVALRFAIAATTLGEFSLASAGARLAWAAAGGIAVGYLVAVAAAWVRSRLHDSAVESVVSLLTPFAAYLPAEWIGASGVLAAVTAGLYVGRRLPTIASSSSRLRLFAVWETLTFLLNAIAFILIGLQLPQIRSELGEFNRMSLLGYGMLISGAVVLIRVVWVFPAAYIRRRDPAPPFGQLVLVAWTGMRGIVSLAAAMALPLTLRDGATAFPNRNLILFLTFCVVLFTLVVQGLSLPLLIRALRLQVPDDEAREESLARLELAHAALARLEGLAITNEDALDRIERAREPYRQRVRYLSPRVRPSARSTHDPEHPPDDDCEICRSDEAILREALSTERRMLVKLRDDGVISDEVLRRIQKELDLDESRLAVTDDDE